ncbi:MAG: twin-arginine translocase TatA/TatE family subunit [Actinomycetota bacterium]
MFNIGTGEMFVVLLIALLVFGPQRLPEIARNLGKAVRAFQQESQKATAIFRDAVDEVDRSQRAAASPPGPASGSGVIDIPASGGSAPQSPVAELAPGAREHEDT